MIRYVLYGFLSGACIMGCDYAQSPDVVRQSAKENPLRVPPCEKERPPITQAMPSKQPTKKS